MMKEETGMMNHEGEIRGRSATLADNGVSIRRWDAGKGFRPSTVVTFRGFARFIIHLSSCIIFFWISLAQAELTARLNTDQTSVGETVQLQVEADGQVSDSPDTKPLTKDFDVLGIASGSRVNIINGQMDARSTWTISLAPKHSGKLTIPALELNGEQTRPMTLQVSEVPVVDGKTADNPIFIETEVDRKDPYVQGMVLYTIRLFYEVKLLEGSLSEPQLDNALVRRLGKDREYNAERNGHRYRVLKRQYAIFPQTSGPLELPATVLGARIPDKTSRRRSPFQDFFGRDRSNDPFFGGSGLSDMFTSTRPVRVRGETQVLQVRPRPAQITGSQWLPAESLALIESWQPEQNQLRVGDPLTRTVTIRARGVTGEQLPELELSEVDGFKVYPDRSQASTLDLEQGVEGEKSRNIAYVPMRPGKYKLPAVSLHWWDTQTDQERVAELPERSVEVLPALSGQGMPVQPSAQPEITQPGASASTADAGKTSVTRTPPPPSGVASGTGDLTPAPIGIWPWLSLLFALLWLATLIVWWRARRRAVVPRPIAGQSRIAQDAAQAKAHFQAACRANDPSLARRSLLAWAAAHWSDDPPAGLDQLAQRLDEPQARKALSELDRLLYRGETQSWDGKVLAQLLIKLPKPGRAPSAKTVLPDLYA